ASNQSSEVPGRGLRCLLLVMAGTGGGEETPIVSPCRVLPWINAWRGSSGTMETRAAPGPLQGRRHVGTQLDTRGHIAAGAIRRGRFPAFRPWKTGLGNQWVGRGAVCDHDLRGGDLDNPRQGVLIILARGIY